MRLVILLTTIGMIVCEYCSDTDSTQLCHMDCGAPLVPLCEAGMCTCGDKPDAGCLYQNDCLDFFKHHHCDHKHRHCVDMQCMCTEHIHIHYVHS